jgi:two-component system CheB/CheR fusion protein
MTSPFVIALREARAALASAATVEPGEAAVARKLERDLSRALERLEGRGADKDLIAVICHDLKDPLASIVMGTGFLRRTIPADDAAGRRVVDAIARSADRMSQVVGDFHDLSKLENGLLSVDLQPCDLVEAVRGIVGPMEADAREKGVRLELEAPDERVVVSCDRARLAQILGKLVGNSLKFTPSGGQVTVRVSGQDRVARVVVADTGRGIPPERLTKVFDHADNARRSPRDGPGLGLAIVRGLVELHAGTVAIESRVGEGTTVVVTFPL